MDARGAGVTDLAMGMGSDLTPGLSVPPLAIAPTMRYNSRLYVGWPSSPTR